MIHFQHPIVLYLLFLIPLLTLLWILQRRKRFKALRNFADENILPRLTQENSRRRPVAKFSLLMLSLALLIVTLANPQVGSKIVKGQRLGSDIAVCLDISNSMLAEDIQPNRLERSKRVVTNLLNELGSDRVSLVVFAGSAYIQMPLTSDYGATKMFLDQISPSMIEAQGTAIGEAIDIAMQSLGYNDPDRKWEKNKGRTIIVISDGENHEDDAQGMAKKAASEGVMVNTIGMGTNQGVPIPEYGKNGQQIGYKKDASGNTVTTHLNEKMLQEIASAGNGIYVSAGGINNGIKDVVKQIEKLEKKNFGEASFSEYETRYQYPLLAALLCLLAEVLLFEKKNPRFSMGRILNIGKNKNN